MFADLPHLPRTHARIRACGPLTAVLAACMAAAPGAAFGQNTPVVQALPNPASAQLSEALRELGRDPQSLDALIRAAHASLDLNDLDSASGFLDRGLSLSPADGRVRAGQARLALKRQQPVEAVRLFGEAQASGAELTPYAAEHALAYDLVGNNSRAQELYKSVLQQGENADVRRSLALSQAISGDQNASEETLLPLLHLSDIAAYRARAFALAILGKPDEAVSIAETMLPERLSSRMAPYLRYMPRLTRAQQAAAADLGVFPRAADIGRDPPEIAALSEQTLPTVPAVQTADARLVPTGPVMGSIRNTPPHNAAQPAVAAAETPVAAPSVDLASNDTPAAAAELPVMGVISNTPARAAAQPAIAAADPYIPTPAPTVSMAVNGAPAAVAEVPDAAELPPSPLPQIATAELPVSPAPVAASVAVAPQEFATVEAASVEPVAAPEPPVQMAMAPVDIPVAASTSSPLQGPETDTTPAARFAAVEGPAPVVVSSLPPAELAATPAVEADLAAAPEPRDLVEAFADFSAVVMPQPGAAGAVDITTITPTRERRPEPKPAAPPAPPPPPPHPSRQWVQVATGRNVSALAFDWRRLRREAGGLLDRQNPHVAAWGQTNRLVIGPVASTKAANDLVAALKEKGVDSFRFASAAGEEVKPLD